MPRKDQRGSLTDYEKRVVKTLLEKQWRNQDIIHLINQGRDGTANIGRVTDTKNNDQIHFLSDDDLEFYIAKKNSYDAKTGLNFYDDERLIKSREAMILAVSTFNSGNLRFKSEQFAVQSVIAWTYLMHEFYERQGVEIIDKNGRSILLSQMIKRADIPLEIGVRNNIRAIIEIRDKVEHQLLRKSDYLFYSLFQANCLNFDQSIRTLFGEKLSLQNELSIALQFSKLDINQISMIQKYDIPDHISALDRGLENLFSDQEKSDLNFRFQVIYTLQNSSKSRAHFEFIQPGSDEGKEIRNILEKRVIADDQYPYKPQQAANEIKKLSNINFTLYNHSQAWKRYKVRPGSKAKDKKQTNKDYCIFHAAHEDYTYNKSWIDFVVEKISDDEEFTALKATK